MRKLCYYVSGIALAFCVAVLYGPVFYTLSMSFSAESIYFDTAGASWLDFLNDRVVVEGMINSFAHAAVASIASTSFVLMVYYVVLLSCFDRRLVALVSLVAPFMLGSFFSGYVLPKSLAVVALYPGSVTGIIAMSIYSVPIAAIVLFPVILNSLRRQVNIARVCGANRLRCLCLIVLPHIWPALVAALLFTFLFSFNNADASNHALGNVSTIQSRIWGSLRNGFDAEIYRINTFLFMLFSGASITASVLILWLNRNRKNS